MVTSQRQSKTGGSIISHVHRQETQRQAHREAYSVLAIACSAENDKRVARFDTREHIRVDVTSSAPVSHPLLQRFNALVQVS